MWLSEDLGDSNAGFMKNEHFRKLLLPYIAELAEYITNLGVPVLLHSCGCINQYLDDLAQTKIASVHPLQRTAKMDLRAVKEKYGKRFTIIGVGGILTPDDAMEKFAAGADLIQLISGMVFEGPGLIKEICKKYRDNMSP